MKINYLLFTLCVWQLNLNSQTPFFIDLDQPGIDHFSDVSLHDDTYYFIHSVFSDNTPAATIESKLVLTTDNGAIIKTIDLGTGSTQFMRILSIGQDSVVLVGVTQSESCLSTIIFSRLLISTEEIEIISTYPVCEGMVQQIRIVEGIADKQFLEEFHTINNGTGRSKSIYKIDKSYNLTQVLDSLFYDSHLSIDFSRTGYVMADVGLYDFYTPDFQFRKQRFNSESHFLALYKSHIPYRQNLILEQSFQHDIQKADFGFQIRLVDSTLHVVNTAILIPPQPYDQVMGLPFYGGLEVATNNELWASGFASINPPLYDTSVFFIAKLDSNLNILCQHFIGGDGQYILFGFRALGPEGAVAFGYRVGDGNPLFEGEDAFALRMGPNCEIPNVVATDETKQHVPIISAYPNPAINQISFSISGFDPAVLEAEFVAVDGQVLFKTVDLSRTIQIPNLTPGQYFYRILQGEKLLGVGTWVKQ